jgi:hypothetical protein
VAKSDFNLEHGSMGKAVASLAKLSRPRVHDAVPRDRLFRILALTPQAHGASEPDKAAITAIVDRYCNAWSEPDAARRQQLLDGVWADDGTYTDPLSHVSGRAALSSLIDGFLKQYPSARMVLSSAVDMHHDRLRFNWKFVAGDGSVAMEGMDFGEIGPDNRLRRIVGFFGPPAPRP